MEISCTLDLMFNKAYELIDIKKRVALELPFFVVESSTNYFLIIFLVVAPFSVITETR